MVAASLRRFESVTETPLIVTGPAALYVEDFLTGNPGIQGSNLFVRLSVLLAVGGFDEGLRSTTDRDLCIRIAELGTVRYGQLPVPLVNHYADSNRLRLSTSGSEAKLEGLTAFWRKYVGRMTTAQRQAFLTRAATVFGWTPPCDLAFVLPPDNVPKNALVLGLFADNERPEGLLDAVRELATWRDDHLVGLDIVLFERGQRLGERPIIDEASTLLRNAGLGCYAFTLEHQNEEAYGFASSHSEMLRVCCAVVAAPRVGTAVWLVEDLARNGQRPPGAQTRDVLRWFGGVEVHNIYLATAHMDLNAVSALERWLQGQRIATAEHRVRRRFSLGQVRLLGCGSEAVVFTDEHRVYKCIDYWKTQMPRPQMDFLQKQVGRWSNARGLYPLRDVIEDGPWAVLTYDYEPSTPTRGARRRPGLLPQQLPRCWRDLQQRPSEEPRRDTVRRKAD